MLTCSNIERTSPPATAPKMCYVKIVTASARCRCS